MAVADRWDADRLTIIRECLRAAVEGPFFPDWEFSILFGLEREKVRIIYEAWPEQTVDGASFKRAIINTLNNLLGYPHGEEQAWSEYISASPQEVCTILQQILE